MSVTLYELLPSRGSVSSDTLLGRFLEYVEGRRLQLYPAQEEAVLELFEGRNVILNTPTGSGKSLVASALHFQSLAALVRLDLQRLCEVREEAKQRFTVCGTYRVRYG